MTALGKVVRTTAFKLSVIYFAVFSVFAVAFVLYQSWNTNALLEAQLKDTIEAEIRGLAEQGRSGGLAAIFQTIETRSHTPGASLYLITDVNGRILTGNQGIASKLVDEVGGEAEAIAWLEANKSIKADLPVITWYPKPQPPYANWGKWLGGQARAALGLPETGPVVLDGLVSLWQVAG